MKRRALLWCVATSVAMSLTFGGVSAFAATRNEVLKDGAKIEIRDGNKVFVICPCQRGAPVAEENMKTKGPVQAKDGTYTLKNGKTIEVKDGRLQPPPIGERNAEEKK